MEDNENLRYNNLWDMGLDLSELGLQANALYQFLVNNDELTPPDDKTKRIWDKLFKKKYEIEATLRTTNESLPKLSNELKKIEQKLEKIEEDYSIVYDLEVEDFFYNGSLTWFKIDKIEQQYAVGDEQDMENATINYLKELYEEIGFDSLPDWVLSQVIDKEFAIDYMQNLYSNVINDSPEDFLDESLQPLSLEQTINVQRAEYRIQNINNSIERYKIAKENLKNIKEINALEKSLVQFTDEIIYLGEFIQEINENPEGDFPDDEIENAINEKMRDIEDDIYGSLKDWDVLSGGNIKSFIDEEALYRLILEQDGFAVMSSYDGEVNEEIVNGELFYIIKIE